MGKINVLGFDIANLIAAGEVVDRPASVVKELLENAIDAGADTVTAEIKNGGISFIRISDNGCGMDAEDLPVSLKRHATSKISTADDLDSILTLGFRGEALAAISSVSKIRIMTKNKDSTLGACLEAEGGNVVSVTEAGCPDGTTVIVEELFFNVPARKKFLRRDVTEAVAVTSTVERIALSRPDIAFKMIVDGEIKFVTAGDGNVRNVIYSLFGREFAKKCIAIDRTDEESGISVTGYASSPEFVKSNRNFQNFYINNRYVKSKTAAAAIEQAYRSYIPQEKFPFCVLFINIAPNSVDVNVHPAKLEVKFSNEKFVFDAVYYAVRTALESKLQRPDFGLMPEIPDKPSPKAADSAAKRAEYPRSAEQPVPSSWHAAVSMSPVRESVTAERYVPAYDGAPPYIPPAKKEPPRSHAADAFAPVQDRMYSSESKVEQLGIPADEQKWSIPFSDIPPEPNEEEVARIAAALMSTEEVMLSPDSPVLRGGPLQDPDPNAVITEEDIRLYDGEEDPPIDGEEPACDPVPAEDTAKAVPFYKIAGEIWNSYVIVEMGDNMLLIDKHAAHERIIFEEMRKGLKNGNVLRQVLLVPVKVRLSAAESDALRQYGEDLEKAGFVFSCTDDRGAGSCTVILTEVPAETETAAAADMIGALAGKLASGEGSVDTARDEFLEAALYQASCKAAIKAGRIYTMEHIKWLCDKLLCLDNIKYCPHGRPVAFEMTKRAVDRQFSRIK